jgi:histidyl-tRNA synthetase
MERIKPHTLSGFSELLPASQMQLERIFKELRKTYALYGYTPLDTPVLEAADVLLAKGGGETEKQIYRFQKGDSDLAMRFDLTVPLAKYVALHAGELSFPFKRYQIGKVYRGERAQRGRFREFYQADIDVIGDGELSIVNEAEIPSIIYRTFTNLGLRSFRIRLNNRKILNGFYAMQGLTEQSADVMRTVDKLDKIGRDKVRAILVDDFAVSESAADAVLDFIDLKGETDDILAALENYRGRNELFDTGLDELSTVVRYVRAFGVPDDHFAIDLTIARGLDYYTGTVYETTMVDHPEIGSICSGGRYDNLAEYYTDRKLPGVGISIGVTRLFYVLGEQGYLNQELPTAPADALLLPMGDDLSPAISLAAQMQNAGVRVQLYAEEKKFKAKMSYANKQHIPFVLFLGEDEIKQQKVSIKDMASGEQETLSYIEAAGKILWTLNQYGNEKPIRDKNYIPVPNAYEALFV